MLISSVLLTVYKFMNRRKETEKGVLMMGFALYITVPLGIAATICWYVTQTGQKSIVI